MAVITIYGIFATHDVTDENKVLKACATTREIAEEVLSKNGKRRNKDFDTKDNLIICPINLYCSDETVEWLLKDQDINDDLDEVDEDSEQLSEEDSEQLLEEDFDESIETSDKKTDDDAFILVETSKLSLEDKFMKHEPTTETQEEFKKELVNVINIGVSDFYRAKYSPSLGVDGNLVFKAGRWIPHGRSFDWWKKIINESASGQKVRFGTRKEYIAFLGDLIKKLVTIGWSTQEAWEAVCDDPGELHRKRYSMNKDSRFKSEYTNFQNLYYINDIVNTKKFLLCDDKTTGLWLIRYPNRSLYNFVFMSIGINLNDEVPWCLLQ